MTKKELLEKIKVLEHNLKVEKDYNTTLMLRLEKVNNYLEKQGLEIKERNDIYKLNWENFGGNEWMK